MPGSDIKRAGLKVTLPRLKVLEVLENADPHHLSAEDVYKNLMDTDDSVGLATVYRVLTQFEAAGIVSRHNFDDGHSVYELASEEHHDHMVDVDNGKVIEFVNERIEDLQHQIAEEHGVVGGQEAFGAHEARGHALEVGVAVRVRDHDGEGVPVAGVFGEPVLHDRARYRQGRGVVVVSIDTLRAEEGIWLVATGPLRTVHENRDQTTTQVEDPEPRRAFTGEFVTLFDNHGKAGCDQALQQF